jgi:dihydrodipicolinate synthase/N-acetylneuraminate lyase
MQTDTMRGVYPILVTPFDEAGRVDEESLRRLVEFDIEAGVHGIGVALGSEVFKLSEAERDHVTRIVVDQVRGRIPVVINTGAPGTELAVLYSQAAEQNGADALMIMPPAFMPATPGEVLEYFQAISNAVNIPIFLQDTPTAPIPPALALQLAETCEWVQYIKVETVPIVVKVADMVEKAGKELVVFGGAGGGYFIEEMRRGSVGTMPFCSQPEAFVEVWNRFQAGDEAGARAVFDRTIAPINRLAAQGSGIFYHVHKELLRHRGIIRTNKVRSPAPPVEALTQRELTTVLEELYP